MVNNEVEYSVIELSRDGSILVIATDCLAALEEVLGESQVLSTLLGSFLCSPFFLSLPLYRPSHPISPFLLAGSSLTSTTYHSLFPSSSSSSPSFTVIPSSHVTATSGTGLVHCAPSHGLDDYLSHRLHFPDLPLLCPVDDDGKFTSELGERFEGKEVLGEGAKEVVSWLREGGEKNLLGVKEIKHKYPYDWKTKEPVITRCVEIWSLSERDETRRADLSPLNSPFAELPPNGSPTSMESRKLQ